MYCNSKVDMIDQSVLVLTMTQFLLISPTDSGLGLC